MVVTLGTAFVLDKEGIVDSRVLMPVVLTVLGATFGLPILASVVYVVRRRGRIWSNWEGAGFGGDWQPVDAAPPREVARLGRDMLRANLETFGPWSLFDTLGWLGGLFLMAALVVFGGKALLEDGGDRTGGLASLGVGGASLAVLTYELARRHSRNRAMARLARRLGGRARSGRRASLRLLAWLDEQAWGPTELSSTFHPKDHRCLAEGYVGARIPVLCVMTAVLREKDTALWEKAHTSLRATDVFIADRRPGAITHEVAAMVAEAGWTPVVELHGMRLRRRGVSTSPIHPRRLVPLIERVVALRSAAPAHIPETKP